MSRVCKHGLQTQGTPGFRVPQGRAAQVTAEGTQDVLTLKQAAVLGKTNRTKSSSSLLELPWTQEGPGAVTHSRETDSPDSPEDSLVLRATDLSVISRTNCTKLSCTLYPRHSAWPHYIHTYSKAKILKLRHKQTTHLTKWHPESSGLPYWLQQLMLLLAKKN